MSAPSRRDDPPADIRDLLRSPDETHRQTGTRPTAGGAPTLMCYDPSLSCRLPEATGPGSAQPVREHAATRPAGFAWRGVYTTYCWHGTTPLRLRQAVLAMRAMERGGEGFDPRSAYCGEPSPTPDTAGRSR